MYIVGYADSRLWEIDFAIVEASDEDTAAQKFVKAIAIHDPGWLEFVLDKSVNLSFAEHFWLQGWQDFDHFERTGSPAIGREEFERRVFQFFGEREDFARTYIDFYFGPDSDAGTVPFSSEMLAFMWLKTCRDDLVVIPLDRVRAI